MLLNEDNKDEENINDNPKLKKMLKRKSKLESELEQWANASSQSFGVESSGRDAGMEVKGILKVGNTCPSDNGAIHV